MLEENPYKAKNLHLLGILRKDALEEEDEMKDFRGCPKWAQ